MTGALYGLEVDGVKIVVATSDTKDSKMSNAFKHLIEKVSCPYGSFV